MLGTCSDVTHSTCGCDSSYSVEWVQAIALHSHAAQRLIGLTVQLARRWLKLSQASGEPLAAPPQELQVIWGEVVVGCSPCKNTEVRVDGLLMYQHLLQMVAVMRQLSHCY